MPVIFPPPRSLTAIQADLERVVARIDELRKSPDFLSCHSPAAQEHSWCSRRAAMLRNEFFERTGGRGAQPGRPTVRY